MKQVLLGLFFLGAFLFLFQGNVIAATSFNRNLKLGDKGEDVRYLQQILNEDPETQVATSGNGAPGNESTYFGQRTKEALIKFQEKYASSTIGLAGLSEGTGILGKLTIAFLSTLLNIKTPEEIGGTSSNFNLLTALKAIQQAINPPPPLIIGSTTTSPVLVTGNSATTGSGPFIPPTPTTPSPKVFLTSIDPKKGGVGTSVTLVGAGFSTSTPNSVYVSGKLIPTSSPDGKTMTIRIPNPFEGNHSNKGESKTIEADDQSSIETAGGRVSYTTDSNGNVLMKFVGTDGKIITSTIPKSKVELVPNQDSLGGGGGSITVSGGEVSYDGSGSSGTISAGDTPPTGKYPLEVPLGIYVIDNSGKVSESKTFQLNY